MDSYEIELDCFETIVAGGVRRVTWHVERGRDWASIADIGRRVEDRDERPPRVVWQRRFAVRVERGARLMRVESRPARQSLVDPIQYLLGPKRSERQVRRSYFVVGARGQLLREERAR